MADKKRARKRKDEYVVPGEEKSDKPTKEEFKLAKWMRKNVPIKKTKFLNHNVEYFTGTRAVDALMESDYAKGDNALFKSREDIIIYLDVMLVHKFYHRARKVPLSEEELKLRGKKDKKTKEIESGDEKKEEKSDKEQNKGTDAENTATEGKEGNVPEKDKRKKKIRLEMHNDQRFVDSLDAYVWIYDPIPFHYWIFGTLLVFGAIGVCLFPLWPPEVRLGVYYLSVAAACFLVFVLGLAVLRFILFCVIWMMTLGRHHLWILPNLTEDVGFFASFWPLYQYEYRPGGSEKVDKKKNKKKKKEKNSDNEDDADTKEETTKHSETRRVEEIDEDKQPLLKEKKDGSDDDKMTRQAPTEETHSQSGGSESESGESESKSSVGRDFEMVDSKDIEES